MFAMELSLVSLQHAPPCSLAGKAPAFAALADRFLFPEKSASDAGKKASIVTASGDAGFILRILLTRARNA